MESSVHLSYIKHDVVPSWPIYLVGPIVSKLTLILSISRGLDISSETLLLNPCRRKSIGLDFKAQVLNNAEFSNCRRSFCCKRSFCFVLKLSCFHEMWILNSLSRSIWSLLCRISCCWSIFMSSMTENRGDILSSKLSPWLVPVPSPA